MRRSRIFSRIALVVSLFVTLTAGSTYAQWRIPTPRDTVNVPANQISKTLSKLKLNSGVEASLRVTGTFNFNVGGLSEFDGGYTLKHPNWNFTAPIKNPPTYGNVKYDYGLRVITSLGLIEDWFKPVENYNNAHIYTSRVTCTGNDLWLYIKGPTVAHNQSATGKLNVQLARWTAGIAVKDKAINFGGVFIGSPATKLDSIASYGLDPLVVQNIQIFGPDSADFSFVSQRDKSFTLPTEQTNEIKVIFSPSRRSDAANPHTAYMVITCKNTDLPSREQIITLTGYGLQPAFGCLVDTLDFGKVRIGTAYEQTRPVNICNPGNANLVVTPINYVPVNYPATENAFRKSTQTSIPMTVTPGSLQQIKNVFSPKARQKYIGNLEITTNVKKESVVLLGEGAEPVPVFSKKKLTFGTVYRGDRASDTFSIRNIGNWTASILLTQIEGDQVFSFTPNEPAFILDPDSVRTYTVNFHPQTTINRDLHAWLVFYYDDGKRDSVELFGTEIQPPIVINDSIYDFGKVKIGAIKTAIVTKLRNTGNIQQVCQWQVIPSWPFSIVTIPQIDANKVDSLTATFTPLVPGPAQSWVHLAASGYRDSILLIGEGAVAKAVFNPNPVDFGIVPSNQWNRRLVTLTDSGNYPLRIIRFEITGTDKDRFQILDANSTPTGSTPLLPYTLLENTSVSIEVGFRTDALTGAAHNATLCVYYDDSTFDCIPLQAIEEKQYLQFATPAVDFGKVRVKRKLQRDVSFVNNSNVELSVGSVVATAASSAFTVVGTPTPVQPKKTMDVAVEFAPPYSGTFVGYAKAFGGSFREDSVQLRGIGAAPIPAFSPDTNINFGSVQLNAAFPGAIQPMVLRNIGNWDLSRISVKLVNDTYGEFDFLIAPGTEVLPPDSSVAFEIYFTPTETIVYHSADLVFTFDDSTIGTVHLVGLDESPNIVLGEKIVDFGKVRLKRSLVKQAHLINTTTKALTAASVRIEPGASEFTSPGLPGTVTVSPNLIGRKLPLDITFTPVIRGVSTANVVISGGDAVLDTTILLGEGAEPVPQFTPQNVLDFGDVLYGISATRTFDIKNIGNWDFQNVTVTLTGTNAADFTQTINPTFLIQPDSVATFSVTFMASSALDITTARTATLTFTIDDSTVFTYELLARDKEPFKTELRFDNLYARPGDVIYPTLRLVNAAPDSLRINHLEGTIIYDPTIVNLEKVELGAMLANANAWTLLEANPPNQTPGRYTYDLSSQTAWLSTPGPLLRLTFKAYEQSIAGSTSALEHESFDYPQRKEVQALLTAGVIIIDSTCGATHVASGRPRANYIEQSSPNPASISAGGTSLLFKIAANETPVTIRIMDVTGNEIARPVDDILFQQGSYRLRVDGSTVRSSGMYFYEFRAGTDKPVVRKMMLEK